MHPTKVTEPWVSAALVTKVHFLVCLSEAIDTLYDPYFHFCGNLALDILEPWGFSSILLGVRLHPLISKLTMVRAFQSANASPDWKWSTRPEIEPLLEQKGGLYTHLCFKKWLSQCRPKPFYSQPRQLPCTWHVVNRSAHCPLPDLSVKPIFKIDHTNWQNVTKVAERCTQF